MGDAAAGGAEAAVGEGGISAHADVLMGGKVLGQSLLGAQFAEGVAHDTVALEGEGFDDLGESFRRLEGEALGYDVTAGDVFGCALARLGAHLEA